MSGLAFAAWFFLGPIGVLLAIFAMLCAWECTALPWLAIFTAPAVTIVMWIVLAIWYLRRDVLTTRTGATEESEKNQG